VLLGLEKRRGVDLAGDEYFTDGRLWLSLVCCVHIYGRAQCEMLMVIGDGTRKRAI
jgi:hypothetical protein